MIPYGKQSIEQSDIDAVVEVLKSEYLTQGPTVPRLEKEISSYVGAAHGIAVNSATSGLHLACLALGVGKGDEVWTSPNTFVASANCALYCGAKVDFVDIDARTFNISIDALEAKLISAREKNRLPKVVIPVHFAGQCCDMESIQKLSRLYGFRVIEDASHAIGGKYKSEFVGSCLYSDITVFSFHPVKIITTGEGGLLTTNHDQIKDKLLLLRSHGITRDPAKMTHASHGGWFYQQLELGLNYRLTDIQAALGLSQMRRIGQFVQRRRELARNYDQMLSHLPISLPWQAPESYSSWHLYVVRIPTKSLLYSKEQVFAKLRELGVGVNLHYIPVHTQPYYQKMGFRWGDFPNAEQYYEEAITLPLHYDLKDSEQLLICQALEAVLCR